MTKYKLSEIHPSFLILNSSSHLHKLAIVRGNPSSIISPVRLTEQLYVKILLINLLIGGIPYPQKLFKLKYIDVTCLGSRILSLLLFFNAANMESNYKLKVHHQHYILVIFITLWFVPLIAQNNARREKILSVINLERDWKYLRGSSITSPSEIHKDQYNTRAQSIDAPAKIQRLSDCDEIWMWIELPDIKMHGQSLFISYVIDILEVYVDQELIYSTGDFASNEKIAPRGWEWHIINLPKDIAGKNLTLHVKSYYGYAGIKGPVQIGSNEAFIYNIIDEYLVRSLIGFILVIGGFVSLLLFVSLGEISANKGLVIAQISMGVWTLTESGLTQLIFHAPTFIYFTYHIALNTGIIGFTIFFETIVADKYKKVIRSVLRLQIYYAVIMTFVDIVIQPEHQLFITPFYIFIFVSILISFWSGAKSFSLIKKEEKILLITLVIYAIFGLVELLWYFHNIIFNEWESIDAHIIHYGGIIFFGFLTWQSISRYVKINKQVVLLQKETIRNQQLVNEAIRNEKTAKETFTKNLIKSQEEERKRIAGELHDSLGQELLIIKNRSILALENIGDEKSIRKHFNEISSLSTQAINEVREITYNLRPFQLDRIGLTKAIQSLVTRAESSSEINFKIYADEIDNVFPKELEINVYRMIQEGINNIIKHSQAASVIITISKEEKEVLILIQDDGIGFSISEENSDSKKKGMGLIGINERAMLFKGEMEIDSAPGKGTKVKITLPLLTDKKMISYMDYAK